MDDYLEGFTITCKICKSENCRTDRDMYPEMRGECKIVCLDCDNTEFCN